MHSRPIRPSIATRLEIASDPKSTSCRLRSVTGICLFTNNRVRLVNACAFEKALPRSRSMHVEERRRSIADAPHIPIPVDVEASVTRARLGYGPALE